MVLGILLVTAALNISGVASMSTFTFLWFSIALLGFLHMFVGLYAARADWNLYRALFYLPRYTMWKTALALKLVRQDRTEEWIRTTREPVAAQENSTKV